MSDALVLTRPTDEVLVVTIDRADRLNALTEDVVSELLATFASLEDDPARCAVITGAGRGFCAGLDLTANADLIESRGPGAVRRAMRIARSFGRLVPAMRHCPKPIVAAVNGPAVGGGFVLALAADLRVAASSAFFADGFVDVGLSGCELGLGYLLPRLVGASRAAELVMTGRRLPADEAAAIGLVHEVVDDPADTVGAAIGLAQRVAANTPFGTWMTKDAMWASFEGASLDTMIGLEARSQVLALLTDDAREKRDAGAQRRAPNFSGD